MFDRYYNVCRALTRIIDNVDTGNSLAVKRLEIFLDWITRKCDFFEEEMKPLCIPDDVFPQEITTFAYNKNAGDTRQIIDKYYYPLPGGEGYVLKENPCFETYDKEHLLGKLVLIRGNVVWVEFGFNVGREFGGKHPAVILKNLGKVIIVAPLSSGKLLNPRSYEIEIEKVYNLPKRDRYVNITRITPVSIYRIDFSSPIGSIHSSKMREILMAIKNEWGF